MRTHGWSGAAPADDDEAIARILEAAKRRIDRQGKDFGISDVAKDVGVTRQTVYRYFPSTEALLYATSVSEVGPFLNSLTEHVRAIHDPAEAVVEAIAHTLERLPHEKYLGLLMTPGKASAFSAGVTSDMAMSFGRALLMRIDVDWHSVSLDGEALDGLVEFMLRILQSLVIDPGRPPHHGKELRTFLRRWIAPAISGTVPAAPLAPPSRRKSQRRTAQLETGRGTGGAL
ncbi:MAG: TetR/AcrR family transcriptional regulator [Mycobacterium sp.]